MYIDEITCSIEAPVSKTLSSVGTGPPGTLSGPVEDAMMELFNCVKVKFNEIR